jgi:hypothetical protein
MSSRMSSRIRSRTSFVAGVVSIVASAGGCQSVSPTVDDKPDFSAGQVPQASTGAPGHGVVNVMRDCQKATGLAVAGDGCTNDGPALNACLAAFPSSRLYFPTTRSGVSYYSAETIIVGASQTIEGDARGYGSGTRVGFARSCPSDPENAVPTVAGFRITSQTVVIRDLVIQGAARCDTLYPFTGLTETSADGIQVRSGWATIQNVRVCGFGGDGVNVLGDGVSLNSNHVFLSNVLSEANVGDGFSIAGVDANAGSIINCQARINAGIGFVDTSSVGNMYLATLAEANKGGTYFTSDSIGSVFITPWAEGGFPSSPAEQRPRFGYRTLVINPIGGMTPLYSSGPNIFTSGASVLDGTRFRGWELRGANRSLTRFSTGTPDWGGSPTAYYMETIDNEFNQNALGAVAVGRSNLDNWWCSRGWNTGEFVSHVESSMCISDTYTQQHTTEQQLGTMPRTWFPHGYLVGDGYSTNRMNVAVATSQPTGPCIYNSRNPEENGIRYDSTPDPGGYLGWVCTTANVWKRFGAIEP